MLSCQRCKQTGSGPQAFLLTCRGCSKTWHHRCHMPPIEDDHLIQLIRATNAGDTANDLSTWMCRRCKKGPSGSREDSKSSTPSYSPAIVTSTADVRVKQESSTTVDARLVNDRERNEKGDRQGLAAKRTKSSAANQPPTQPRDAGATSTKFTPQEEKRSSSTTHSHQVKAARKFVSTISTTPTEDDVEMKVNSPTFSGATSRTSQTPFSIRPESVVEAPPHVHAANSTNERGREVRPVDIQPQVNQVAADEGDDDPEDLYGPPVERRIIRILPSLAEELREQQRRVAAEKEKRRAPLAPDWIFAKHAHDPLWKETQTEGRKRRKPTARKLGDTGLNVNELMGCFTVQNWVREHKT